MNQRIRVPHPFAANPLDRGERERRDEDWLSRVAIDPTTKLLPMADLNVPIAPGTAQELAWITPSDLQRSGVDTTPVFLGLIDSVAHFVVDVTEHRQAIAEFQDRGLLTFEDARAAAEYVSGPESGIIAQARAQLNWHNRHGFCSVCGNASYIARGGQVRRCPECKTEHYPRTDPVVITVVHDEDRCLLGQSRGRLVQMRRYSALAGFMDQGESIEEAVAREIMEEAGIQVGAVTYHSSQPWPFPSSLMIGCHAGAATTEIAMDTEEMADVRWFDREEVLLALEERSDVLAVPGPLAIAYHLIRAWALGEAG
jgi:NAD+ diphosphatase